MLNRFLKRSRRSLLRAVSRVFRLADYRWSDIQTTFIISTGRTGTAFLAQLFSHAFSGVDARHEPPPDLYDLNMLAGRRQISDAQAARQLEQSRLDVCAEVHRAGQAVYVESNNNLSCLVPALRAVFDDYRIVHVVRDGRDVVRSWWGKRVAARNGMRDALVLSDQDKRTRLRACDVPGDPYADQWERMSRFERLCWLWSTKDRIIRDAISSDERAMTVKFESIFSEDGGYGGLWRIVDFLGLRARMRLTPEALHGRMQVKVNSAEAYVLPKWPGWAPEMVLQFKAVAGDHLGSYGYEW